MTLAAAVYAKQLFYRGHGLPMWIPEPSEFGTVQIGDVGYVVDGCFYRLFNATRPADHSLNCNGVPASYEPLVFKPSLVHRVNDYLPPGPLCSRSVRDAEIRIGIAAEGAAGGASYRFTCSEDRGALVVIGGDATREQVHPNSIFPNYMRRHYESWHAFANDSEHFSLALKPEDIIFVRGWVKTTEWAVAAFLDKGTAHELSFQAGIGSYAHADFTVSKKEQISTSLEWRSGPKQGRNTGQENGRDQCIFLSAYKLKRRSLLPPAIKAMSEPIELHCPCSPDPGLTPSPTCSDDSAFTIGESPPVVVMQDPLEEILDYILEKSTADVAIASHCCLEEIFRAGMRTSRDELAIAAFLGDDPRTEIVVDGTETGTLRAETLVKPSQTCLLLSDLRDGLPDPENYAALWLDEDTPCSSLPDLVVGYEISPPVSMSWDCDDDPSESSHNNLRDTMISPAIIITSEDDFDSECWAQATADQSHQFRSKVIQRGFDPDKFGI